MEEIKEYNLAQVAQDKLQHIISSGSVDKMIEDQLTATCKRLISEMFSDWSPFSKELKKVVEDKMAISLTDLNIGSYATMVCQTIEEVLSGTVLEDSKTKIKTSVQQILEKIEKKAWKLSEIVKVYRESLSGDMPEVVVEVDDERYSSIWVRIGEKKEKSYRTYSNAQSYDIRLLVDAKTKVVQNVWKADQSMRAMSNRIYNHSVDALLMKLWAYDCTLELDIDDAEYEGTKSQYED